jgi:hypothetical protein
MPSTNVGFEPVVEDRNLLVFGGRWSWVTGLWCVPCDHAVAKEHAGVQ